MLVPEKLYKEICKVVPLALLRNLGWWYNLLIKLRRWFRMKSSYWVAIGAISVPSAMVWVLESPPEWSPFLIWIPAIVLVFLGVIYLHKGWVDIEAEGELRRKEKESLQRREKQRRRESRAMLIVLTHISRRHPVNIRQVDRILERWAEEEQMTELLKGDAPEDDAY